MAIDISTSLRDITGAFNDIFGEDTEQRVVQTERAAQDTFVTEQLKLDQAAIDQIIEDVLGASGGLADIFAGEQTAGIFDSSVAAQASGDLAAKLVGELAKVTAQKETATDVITSGSSRSGSSTETGSRGRDAATALATLAGASELGGDISAQVSGLLDRTGAGTSGSPSDFLSGVTAADVEEFFGTVAEGSALLGLGPVAGAAKLVSVGAGIFDDFEGFDDDDGNDGRDDAGDTGGFGGGEGSASGGFGGIGR